jgi:hypothetical protein
MNCDLLSTQTRLFEQICIVFVSEKGSPHSEEEVEILRRFIAERPTLKSQIDNVLFGVQEQEREEDDAKKAEQAKRDEKEEQPKTS